MNLLVSESGRHSITQNVQKSSKNPSFILNISQSQTSNKPFACFTFKTEDELRYYGKIAMNFCVVKQRSFPIRRSSLADPRWHLFAWLYWAVTFRPWNWAQNYDITWLTIYLVDRAYHQISQIWRSQYLYRSLVCLIRMWLILLW